MFEAQLLISKSTQYSVYGPWFPKGGESAKFVVDIVELEIGGGSNIEVDVLTKNTEDTGDGGASIANSGALNTVGLHVIDLSTESTIKELVRYKYTLPDIAAGDWFLFRMLAPVWYSKV